MLSTDAICFLNTFSPQLVDSPDENSTGTEESLLCFNSTNMSFKPLKEQQTRAQEFRKNYYFNIYGVCGFIRRYHMLGWI